MTKSTTLGALLQRFLVNYLTQERNVSPHTQQSYRDTFILLLRFLANEATIDVDTLSFDHVSAEGIRRFLQYLEVSRHCSCTTRNQRLAAIHAFARCVAAYAPERMVWCEQIRSIPFKKGETQVMPYLEKSEMDTLLALPDLASPQGRREYALLLFLYNTGARVSEAVCVTIADLDLHYHPSVKIHGKGRKVRYCPLWAVTARTLQQLVQGRMEAEQVFLNRCGQPMTRFGMHTMVERYVVKLTQRCPACARKRISPHTIRHTTAVHLLRAGVDLNTIRAWLGHVSLNTTNIYAEIDLAMKAKALDKCDVGGEYPVKATWKDDPGLLRFLQSL